MNAILAYFTIHLQDVFICSDYYLNNFFYVATDKACSPSLNLVASQL